MDRLDAVGLYLVLACKTADSFLCIICGIGRQAKALKTHEQSKPIEK